MEAVQQAQPGEAGHLQICGRHRTHRAGAECPAAAKGRTQFGGTVPHRRRDKTGVRSAQAKRGERMRRSGVQAGVDSSGVPRCQLHARLLPKDRLQRLRLVLTSLLLLRQGVDGAEVAELPAG